jgi:IS5 family transposase
LYLLANVINWEMFKENFKKHYKENLGRPAKPIRLMTSLLMLKYIRDLCDESIVAKWVENAYYQYFS